MGCDIHAFVEYKGPDAPKWWETLCYDDLSLPRDYNLFGILAGVRTYHDPIVEPRGLPEDVMAEVREEVSDGTHTPSWLTVDEYAAALDRYAEAVGRPAFKEYRAVLAAMRVLAEDGSTVRLVFAFDN